MGVPPPFLGYATVVAKFTPLDEGPMRMRVVLVYFYAISTKNTVCISYNQKLPKASVDTIALLCFHQGVTSASFVCN